MLPGHDDYGSQLFGGVHLNCVAISGLEVAAAVLAPRLLMTDVCRRASKEWGFYRRFIWVIHWEYFKEMISMVT